MRNRNNRISGALLLALWLLGCSDDATENGDAAVVDSRVDVGIADVARPDAPGVDIGAPDQALSDKAQPDKAQPDKAAPDMLVVDQSPPDAGLPSLFAKQIGGVSSDRAHDVAVDSKGAILVSGFFSDKVDFGGGVSASVGTYDAFLVKYDKSGKYLWSVVFGAAKLDHGNAVAVDSQDNVILAATISGTVKLGGKSHTGQGQTDVLLAKFDTSGKLLWAKVFGDASADHAEGVAVDSAKNIILVGYFQGSIEFGGTKLTNAGQWDAYVARLAPAGNHLWSKALGGAGKDRAFDVVTDSKGDVVVTGDFTGKTNFGGGVLTGYGAGDVFLAKYKSATGAHLWSYRYGSNSTARGSALAVDGKDNIALAGQYSGGLSLGCLAKHGTSGSFSNIFLVKYDSTGYCQWSKAFGAKDVDWAEDVAMDSKGNVIMAGVYVGAMSFGGAPVKGFKGLDGVVAKYDGNGTFVWNWAFGDANWDVPSALAVDSQDNVVAAGYFDLKVKLGPTTFTSKGSTDVFLFKLAP